MSGSSTLSPWPPDERELRSRLAAGKARAASYGIVAAVGHVAGADMADKLIARQAESGILRCYLCGNPSVPGAWHLDHVLPLAAGGNHELSNLEPACELCNLVKGDTVLLWPPPLIDLEPLLSRLRAQPPEVVWAENPALARKVLRRPRPVPIEPSIGEFATAGKAIAVLARQADPYRAMTNAQIATESTANGQKLSAGGLARDWLKVMGLSTHNGNVRELRERPHNARVEPHSMLVATRVVKQRGQWGAQGFRLRFRLPLSALGPDFVDSLQIQRFGRDPRGLRDHDEVVPG